MMSTVDDFWLSRSEQTIQRKRRWVGVVSLCWALQDIWPAAALRRSFRRGWRHSCCSFAILSSTRPLRLSLHLILITIAVSAASGLEIHSSPRLVMCRLLVFKGVEPIQLSNLVTKPAHSIINQAFDARLRLDATRSVNGDGFGLGWYDAVECEAAEPSSSRSHHKDRTDDAVLKATPRDAKDANPEAPCIFTSVTPAWNNQNLRRLCEKIRSPLVFAHVRASTAGALSETNCHPWRFGRLMWMHNGQISSFSKLKRTLLSSLNDELLDFPQGQTDSEWAFALFLSHLDRPHREEAFGWKELKTAMEKTIADLNAWAKSKGVQEVSGSDRYRRQSLYKAADDLVSLHSPR